MTDRSRISHLPMTAAYFRLILRRFGTTPARRAALHARTGVDPARDLADPDAEITVGAQLRQVANLQRIARPGFGLDLGAALDGVAHGPAGAAAVTAPTVAAGLNALARYAPVRTPFIEMRVARTATGCELQVLELRPFGDVRGPLLEMVLLSIQGVLAAALGRRVDAAEFRMPAPRPSHWRRYAEHFHAPVRFAGDVAAVGVPDAWLELPCPFADRVAHRDALARLELLRRRLAGDFVDALVERQLGDADDDAVPTMRDVARRLRLSPRTLVRRLGARGTSFRALVDEHRRRRADLLLADARLSVAEIADLLGYEDATNFGRACRRWFGSSPRAYRARRASVAAAAPAG